MLRRPLIWTFLTSVFVMISFAQAQDADTQNRGRDRGSDRGRDRGPDGGRDRGNFDPAQMRQRYMDSFKQSLGVTDEEWLVLQAKVEKVMALQRDMRSDRFGFMSGRGPDRGSERGSDRGSSSGPGGFSGFQSQSKVALAQRDLRAALEGKTASLDEILKKLAVYRDARDKAREELQAAQKDLKSICTPRQEAALVANGILD